MMKTDKGIHLDPAEMMLLAKACDVLASELETEADATIMLNVMTLGTAFRAQALADAFEFYLTPQQKAEADAWAFSITKGIQL
jgi:hypothetical protein